MDIKDLEVHFPLGRSLIGKSAGAVKAVDGISITLRKGEVLGLVGESGSGKTTLGRTLLGLTKATGGSIDYLGRELVGLKESQLRPLRRQLQMVFQDPHASLNPAMSIAVAVGHPLEIHGIEPDADKRRTLVAEALEKVGLSPASLFLDKFPSDLSGGQKQRAVLARAIIAGPDLVVADEPISMLDMSVRAKILQLFLDLKKDLDLTYVYVTHDLASAKFFCDRIAIMYLGRIVEIGTAAEIFADPKHPYTKALLGAIPDPDPHRAAVPRELPRGEIPDAARPPLGCSFHPRCPVALAGCGWEARDLRALLERRWLEAPDTAASEQALFADLKGLETPGLTKDVTIAPGRGNSAESVLAYLEKLRDEQPEEPFWLGVTQLAVRDGKVVISFADSADPRLKLVETTTSVACHLY